MSTKSWKSNQDGHKTSNSLIFSEYHKSSSPANNTNGFPNKNNI